MIFYLGTHQPSWLSRTEIPLFVSRRTMPKKKVTPSTCRWALDSGGFTELSMYGRWTITPRQYADEVKRWSEYVGNLDWAAVQDWMCEPAIIHGGSIAGRKAPGTGLSIREHQEKTIDSFLTLKEMEPDLPWTPVLQGWRLNDYARHLQMYGDRGIDLTREKVVGVGSVCRRQGTVQIARIFRTLSWFGLKLHGFGVKADGIRLYRQYLTSADSMAWSFNARRKKLVIKECIGEGHINCANCLTYAGKWYRHINRIVNGG